MAEQLVEAMSSDWQPEQYRDTYREDLLRLIDRKIQGGEVAGAAEPAAQGDAADVVDIMALLKRSMERRRKEEKRAALDGDAGVAGGARTEATEKPAAAARSDFHTKTKRAG